MAYIHQVPDDEASGLLRRVYDAALSRAGMIFNIVRIMSLNPATLRSSLGLYQSTMIGRSPLSRALRELLATVVSRANNCYY